MLNLYESRTVPLIEAPDPQEVRSWLAGGERKFIDSLKEYGKLVGQGYQKLPLPGQAKFQEVFTGQFLCVEAASAIFVQFQKKFSRSDLQIYCGFVNALCLKPPVFFHPGKLAHEELNHNWLRFTGSDRKVYWIDPTHGQVNFRMREMIAMGEFTDEQRAFRYDPDKVELFNSTHNVTKDVIGLISNLQRDAAQSNLADRKAKALIALHSTF